jgi:electron transfer flavoprotein alpha/beta subunit
LNFHIVSDFDIRVSDFLRKMNTIVYIKQVPATSEIKWDPKTGTLMREGAEGVLNLTDKNALEAALQLKEEHGGHSTALSMGPPQAEEVLREALSMGIDRAILLSDKAFAGADTLSTAYTLSLAAKKIGSYDLILCGKESSDGMTAQVGPQVAEFLDLPQLTWATEITIQDASVRIKQKIEDGFRILEAPLPAVITVEREINRPRIPTMDTIMEAYRSKEVTVWTAGDLEGDPGLLGLGGSPTQSRAVYTRHVKKGEVTILEGEPDEVAGKLIETLQLKALI